MKMVYPLGCIVCLSFDWQYQFEHAMIPRFGRETAAMRLGDGTADRQAQAKAAGLGRLKRLKQSRSFRIGQTGAAVRHHNADPPSAFRMCRDADAALARRTFGNCIERI